MDMTVRELIQELLLSGNLDNEIAINDPKDPFIVTANIKVVGHNDYRCDEYGVTYISIKEGE